MAEMLDSAEPTRTLTDAEIEALIQRTVTYTLVTLGLLQRAADAKDGPAKPFSADLRDL